MIAVRNPVESRGPPVRAILFGVVRIIRFTSFMWHNFVYIGIRPSIKGKGFMAPGSLLYTGYYSLAGEGIRGRHPPHCCQVLESSWRIVFGVFTWLLLLLFL